MRCQPDVPLGPAEGLSWESAGPPERGVRGISGGSAGEMDFVDPATRRMTYEVSSGHLAGPLHAVSIDLEVEHRSSETGM